MSAESKALASAPLISPRKRHAWWLPLVCLLFFFSGFPALIYQIVWQRALFAIYGVNIESVTMVVTAFMLGLGLGSLAGGYISKSSRIPKLMLFGVVELGIGAFGLVSLRVFHFAAIYTALLPPLQTGLVAFTLVVVPTVLMGSTLPLLAVYLVRYSGNTGRSIGILYFVNTLGSAVACFVAALFTMRYLGESGSVKVAASGNMTVGLAVLTLYILTAREQRGDAASAADTAAPRQAGLFSFPAAMLVAGLAGFISLAYEIAWYRIYSFTSGGEAWSFSFLLGAYLSGIAFGSLLVRFLCREIVSENVHRYARWIALFIIAANLFGFLVIPAVARLVTVVSYTRTFPLVTLAAALLGLEFPLICHVAIRPDTNAGSKLSYVYLSNIIGSALGSYVFGFILLDHLVLRQAAVLIAFAGIVLGMALLLSSRLKPVAAGAAMASAAVLAAVIAVSAPSLFRLVYERLQYKREFAANPPFVSVVENKSGVITVSPDGTVFGGGVYDGRFNTSLVGDRNMIVRAYAISAFHPAPKQVLMIGLASGSWAQVIANHPQLEKLTIVEINPGYLQLIAEHEDVRSLLHNPKVEIVIDDGRRWLIRHPDRKFDVSVLNTTWNWRAHASNLLSVEFLQLIRKHLNPQGVHYYNGTSAGEVYVTAMDVFPYALRVENCIAVSDSPIRIDRERWRNVLVNYRIDGQPVLDLSKMDQQRDLDAVLSMSDVNPSKFHAMEYADTMRVQMRNRRPITDDNMGTEWVPWWLRHVDLPAPENVEWK